MAFKRSAVRSRLSPPFFRPETAWFWVFSFAFSNFSELFVFVFVQQCTTNCTVLSRTVLYIDGLKRGSDAGGGIYKSFFLDIVCVDSQCHLRVGVSHEVLDFFNVQTSLKKPRAVCVPENMRRDVCIELRFARMPPHLSECGLCERLTVAAVEHIERVAFHSGCFEGLQSGSWNRDRASRCRCFQIFGYFYTGVICPCAVLTDG